MSDCPCDSVLMIAANSAASRPRYALAYSISFAHGASSGSSSKEYFVRIGVAGFSSAVEPPPAADSPPPPPGAMPMPGSDRSIVPIPDCRRTASSAAAFAASLAFPAGELCHLSACIPLSCLIMSTSPTDFIFCPSPCVPIRKVFKKEPA